jgi:hypothetical protein
MLAEAGGKSIDSLTFQAMMSRKLGQVCWSIFSLIYVYSFRETAKKPSKKLFALSTGSVQEKLTEMISNMRLLLWESH